MRNLLTCIRGIEAAHRHTVRTRRRTASRRAADPPGHPRPAQRASPGPLLPPQRSPRRCSHEPGPLSRFLPQGPQSQRGKPLQEQLHTPRLAHSRQPHGGRDAGTGDARTGRTRLLARGGRAGRPFRFSLFSPNPMFLGSCGHTHLRKGTFSKSPENKLHKNSSLMDLVVTTIR